MSPLTLVRGSFSIGLVVFLVCGVGLTAQQSAVVGLRVFGDVDFKGLSAGFVRDTPDLASTGMARTVSSLQVAPGEVWEVCTEPNYGGRCRTVSEDVDDLRRGGWNDVILSARRIRGGAGRGFGSGFGTGGGRPGATGLHIYGDIDFKGSSATLTSNADDLAEQGMARMVSSLRVDPGETWQLCTEANFRGRCLVVTEDEKDLRRGNWNDVIVSARRVRGASSNFGGGRGRGLEVFADNNFRGRSVELTANTPDVAFRGMNRNISSIRVTPGEIWEVCTEANYRGRCETIFEDVPDLRRGEWNDVIASARRVR